MLLAENECDMQLMLNTLNEWCKKWRMVINYEKTQIIHFRPKRKLLTTNEFKLGNAILKFVSSYRYLGCTINENLDRSVTGNILAQGASKALGKLLSKFYLNKGLGFKTFTKIFDSCICPVLDYCSGVWGFNQNDNIDKIQFRAM